MATFWEQFKKPFATAKKTVGSLFTKAKAPTPEGYRPYKSPATETAAQLFGVGKRPSAIKETITAPFKKRKEAVPDGYRPYKSEAVETMAQMFGVGKRPSTIIETLEEPQEAFDRYLRQAQAKRLEKRIAEGKKPASTARFFGEEFGKELAVTTIEIAKNLAKAPFKITKQFKYHPLFYKEDEPKWDLPVLGEITTYGKDFLEREKEFRKMGVDETTANIAAMINVGAEAILDVAIIASWLESGAKAVAKKATPQLQERIAAWKMLGEPKTAGQMNKTWRQMAHQFHPDRIGKVGETTMKAINSSYTILQKGGLPTAKELITARAAKVGQTMLSPISRIMELPRPVYPQVALPEQFLLPERAGYVPVQAYQPLREVKVGLQIRPTPMKPAAGKAPTKTMTELMKAPTKAVSSIQQAKNLGFKVSVSTKGFTTKGFKYKLQKGKDLMYANTEQEITELIQPTKLPEKTMAEVMKPVGAPPTKLPTPKRISPAPEEPPKGLEITERRMRELDSKGITPEEFAPALEAQKRGKIPFPEIIKRSEALTTDINRIATMKPGTIKRAEEVEAYRQTVNGFKREVDKLEQNYLADPTNESNKVLFDKARAVLNRAVVNVEAIRSEMARGLSAARIEDEISRAASNINKIREKLTPEKQIIFDRAIDNISLANPSEVMKLLTEFNKAGVVNKVLEYYKAALLSAPITHIRNTAGNSLFLVFDIPVRALAGGLDSVKAITGKPRTVYTMEAIKELNAGLRAVPDAVTEAMKALRDEFYQYGVRRMTVEAGKRLPAIKGLKGRIIRLPYRALSAMDLFSRTIKTAMETDALAYRLAKQEGLKGTALIERIAEIKLNPPADMVSLISAKADRALFLEELNGVLKGLEGFKNRYPVTQFVIPFYRTPVNLVREAYRLTPARLITAKSDVWLKNPSTRMEEIARMVLGSLLAGTLLWRTLDGSVEITGPAPTKTSEKDLFYRQGKQPYSVKIGNRWYSYREVHPFSDLAFGVYQMGELVNLYKERGKMNAKEVEKQADRIITQTSKFIQDQTFFQGLANFVEAISGGTYNQGVLSAGGNYLAQLFGGFIPNFLYSYQRAADPTIYNTEGFAEEIKKRIPGMQESLLPRRTVFGTPIERTGGFLIQFLSPVKVSEEKRSMVDTELERLQIAVGYPTRTAFSIPLTNYEYDAYLKDSGHRIYERIWDVMQEADYQQTTDYEKQRFIEKIAREAREQSRYALFGENKKLADFKKMFEMQGFNEAQAMKMAEDELKKPRTMAELLVAKTAGTLEDLRSLIAK